MAKYELEKLIRSLSSAEKKNFKLYTAKYQGDKAYIHLFELICDHPKNGGISVEQVFAEKFPATSFENTAAYLFKVLTDMLVQVRIEQDKWFAGHFKLMKARLCFERSLPERGMKELKKTIKLAVETQDHLTYYQASRMELRQLSDNGFPDMSEQELVDKQMKARQTLLSLRQIQEHYSLYELLNYRLTHSGMALTGQDSKKLNDLILGELSISVHGSKQQFESKKIHLLFQSFFFMHTEEYHSALRVFKELNTLIEANEVIWDFPPYDYLFALDGILDSLRSIHFYDEMDYFIDKAAQLATRNYPEHFGNMAQNTLYLYRLNRLVGSRKLMEALQFFGSMQSYLQQKEHMTHHEKHLELLFFVALAHFLDGQWNRANKYLGQALEAGKGNTALAIYRVCRLLHILIHVELDHMDYLDYELRAYKRTFRKLGKPLLTEKLIFQTVGLDPKRSSKVKKGLAWKKIGPLMTAAESEKGERQLLKYFNFCDWIRTKLVVN